MARPKVLIWDLETGGVNAFKADLGFIFNFGYKWLGSEQTHCIKVCDFPGWWSPETGVVDGPLIEAALKIMTQADMLVAHYGDKFDRRFFQGRCVINGIKPPPPTIQRDTWRIARGAFSFSSNRLGNLAKALGLKQQKYQKTANEWPGWWIRGMAGHIPSIRGMAKYCKQDVRTLEQVYLKLRVYDNFQHPKLFDSRDVCGLCGGSVHYAGIRRCVTRSYKRFRCVDCGRWGKDSKALPL